MPSMEQNLTYVLFFASHWNKITTAGATAGAKNGSDREFGTFILYENHNNIKRQYTTEMLDFCRR